MDLNRNQFFFAGLVVLMIGLQVRAVRSYVLTPETTQAIAEFTGSNTQIAQASGFNADYAAATLSGSRKVVDPPEWLGWCLMSIGAVLVLHSLAMPKPGGK